MIVQSSLTSEINVRLLTDLGWARGKVAVAAGQTFADHLEQNDGVLRLRDATIPSRRQSSPFLVLRCDAVRIAITEEMGIHRRRSGLSSAGQAATLLLETYAVTGLVDLGIERRLSDVFTERHAFIRVQQATLYTEARDGQFDELADFSDVYVNVKRVRAACEAEGYNAAADAQSQRVAQD